MAKVKIIHKVSGVVSSVSAKEAQALKSNPRFKDVYTFEEPAEAPKEIKTQREPQQPPKTNAPREVG